MLRTPLLSLPLSPSLSLSFRFSSRSVETTSTDPTEFRSPFMRPRLDLERFFDERMKALETQSDRMNAAEYNRRVVVQMSRLCQTPRQFEALYAKVGRMIAFALAHSFLGSCLLSFFPSPLTTNYSTYFCQTIPTYSPVHTYTITHAHFLLVSVGGEGRCDVEQGLSKSVDSVVRKCVFSLHRVTSSFCV